MKAILVTDRMPNSCAVCPYRINKGHWRCLLITDLKGHPKYIYRSHEDITRARYSGCPLKQIPDCPDVPDTIANDVAYIIGWNDCIVEISKERKEAKSLIKNEKESVSNANGTSIK